MRQLPTNSATYSDLSRAVRGNMSAIGRVTMVLPDPGMPSTIR